MEVKANTVYIADIIKGGNKKELKIDLKDL